MTNLTVLMEDELESRGLIYVKELARLPIASAGAHIFNIENNLRMNYQSKYGRKNAALKARKALKDSMPSDANIEGRKEAVRYPELTKRHQSDWKPPMWIKKRRIMDTRIHLMDIRPIGMGKSEIMKQMTSYENAPLRGTYIRPVLRGSMTEPNWVGTIQMDRGKKYFQYGEAYKQRMSIVSVEEFDSLAKQMKSGHSGNLENQLLTSLDSGDVTKGLAGGTLSYKTFVTLWTASQPTRINLNSGLARRFSFQHFVPDEKTYKEFVDNHYNDQGNTLEYGRTDAIRDEYIERMERLKNVTYFEYNRRALKNFTKNWKLPHFELDLLDRIAVGWAVMVGDWEEEFIVTITDPVKKLIKQQMKARTEIKFGSNVSHVRAFLRNKKREVSAGDIINFMVTYHSSMPRDITETIKEMNRLGLITHRPGGKIRLTDRKLPFED